MDTSRTAMRRTSITPELPEGSYFENLTGRSQRLEGTAALYLPPRQWLGRHDVKAGLDVDHIALRPETDADAGELSARGWNAASGRVCLRRRRHSRCTTQRSARTLQDRWQPGKGEDGWLSRGCDSIGTRLCGRPLLSPRLAAVYSPPGDKNQTKISAGIGLYYEHTQLDVSGADVSRAFATTRTTRRTE